MKRFMTAIFLAVALVGAALAAGDLTGDWFYAHPDTQTIGLGSSASLKVSSTADGRGTFDTGITRSSAGTIRITNGSTSNGALHAASVGPSTSQQHTLPAVTSDTFTLNGATQTLTGKTLAGLTVQGVTTNAYLYADPATNELRSFGPFRITQNSLASRYGLRWVAGSRGKPGVNGDINSATEATREIADPDFEILGTNGVSASSTFYAEGGIVLTTAGAADDQVILCPHLDANQSAWTQVTWGTDKETEWSCDITTGASITNVIIWAGLKLTSTPTVATDNDQVYFRFEDDVTSGTLHGVSSIGGTDTDSDLGLTVAINTRYHLTIAIDSSRIARFYANGVLYKTTAALTNATDFIPYVGIENDGGAGAAKAVRVHGQAISRIAN